MWAFNKIPAMFCLFVCFKWPLKTWQTILGTLSSLGKTAWPFPVVNVMVSKEIRNVSNWLWEPRAVGWGARRSHLSSRLRSISQVAASPRSSPAMPSPPPTGGIAAAPGDCSPRTATSSPAAASWGEKAQGWQTQNQAKKWLQTHF